MGGVEVLERPLGHERGHLGAEPAGEVVLVHDQRLAGLAHRGEDGLPVQRREGAQVDHLHADALGLELPRRLEAVVGHETPGKAAQALALPPDHGRADRRQVVAVRHLFCDQAVQLLVLEEEDGVGVAHRRLEEAVRVGGHARHDDLQPGHMSVEGLDRLRVVQPAVNPAAERGPDHDGHAPVAIRPVPRPRRLADDLVEGGMDEVGELDLGDRDEAVERRPDRNADDRRLRERGVEHTRLAEARVQAICGAEHAALLADVLTEDEDSLVALHLLGDGGTHRLDHPHLGHLNFYCRA